MDPPSAYSPSPPSRASSPLPHVRPARAEDLPVVSRLEREVFPDPWSESAFAATLARSDAAFLVAEDERKTPVGYAVGVAALDEGEVLNLAVDPRHRRRGVARALLSRLETELRRQGAARIYLEVRPTNQPAIALYERLGFRRIGRRRGYYAKPREDAVTMVLEAAGGVHKKDEEQREIG